MTSAFSVTVFSSCSFSKKKGSLAVRTDNIEVKDFVITESFAKKIRSLSDNGFQFGAYFNSFQNLCKIEKDDKIGYINMEGDVVIPCKYDDVLYDDILGKYLFVLKDENENYSLLNDNEEVLLKNEEYGFSEFHDGLSLYRQGEFFGYVNGEGEIVIPPKLYSADDFENGFAVVDDRDWKKGVINKEGELVVPYGYDEIFIKSIETGWVGFLVKKNEKSGLLNSEGKVLIPCQYDELYNDVDISETLFVAVMGDSMDKKYGLVNKEGKEILPCIYESIYNGGDDGLAWVALDGKLNVVDSLGNVVDTIPSLPVPAVVWEYGDYAHPEFHNGLAPYYDNKKGQAAGRYGFINKKGEIVIPCVFKLATNFCDYYNCDFLTEDQKKCNNNCYAFVADEKGKFGVIDTKGNYVLHTNYELYDENGLHLMLFGDRIDYALINAGNVKYYTYNLKEKKEIKEIKHYEVLEDDWMKIEEDGKYGIVDSEGKVIFPCVFEKIGYFANGLALVEKDGKEGFIDKHGNSTFDIK